MDIPVYKVDSSVPLPEDRGRLPLSQLEIGDSFVFPAEKRKAVQSYASVVKKRTGKQFTVRKQDDQTCRIWRKA